MRIILNDASDLSLEDTLGVGIDITEIQRFRDLDTSSAFYKRVYTDQELEYCSNFSDSSSHLAAIFAGKEAVIKAIGDKSLLSMKSIEIAHDDDGSPKATICQLPEIKILLSLAHSKTHAVAIALTSPYSNIAGETALQNLLTRRISELLEGCE